MRSGRITIISSTVKGGKTKYLIGIAETISYHGGVLYINHDLDNRTSDEYSSHSILLQGNEVKQQLSKKVDLRKFSTFDQIFEYLDSKLSIVGSSVYHSVFLDEGQFWEGLVEGVRTISEKYGLNVYVGGLFSDSDRKPFGELCLLVAIADKVKILDMTRCDMCSRHQIDKPAVFSYCKVTKHQQILVGTDYIPVCRDHYLHPE